MKWTFSFCVSVVSAICVFAGSTAFASQESSTVVTTFDDFPLTTTLIGVSKIEHDGFTIIDSSSLLALSIYGPGMSSDHVMGHWLRLTLRNQPVTAELRLPSANRPTSVFFDYVASRSLSDGFGLTCEYANGTKSDETMLVAGRGVGNCPPVGGTEVAALHFKLPKRQLVGDRIDIDNLVSP